MRHTRNRYQHGSLTTESRKTGPAVWVYRWRESNASGVTVQRKRNIGSKVEFPTKSAALKQVESLRLDINVEATNVGPGSVAQLIEHYKSVELADSNGKTRRTKDVYKHQLDNVISPKWGGCTLREVKAIAVERWLNEMPLAPGTKAKTKSVFSALFQHAMRYEWATANPIRLVRQGAMPQQEEIVLDPVEVAALLSELLDPFRIIVFLAAVTGLRRGELFGLKWEDVSFQDAEIKIVRSIVDQVEGPPKTLASRRPIPLSSDLISALATWRTKAKFSKESDWVFASPHLAGKLPYWPDAVLKRHVLPAADRAGIVKRIGWHSFRRTLATLLHSNGATMKTSQELLRHSSPAMTLGTYTKGITAEKRLAQETVATMFLSRSNEQAA